MTRSDLQTDIAILGGGIAGLWLLNLLRDQGFNALLLEKHAIGAGQTLASQGMIHGGIKYALGGLLTDASESIASMPQRWQDCLDGRGTLDLRGVETLSSDYFLFSDSRLTSRITAFFGSKAIEGRVTAVDKKDAPAALQHPEFNGLIYRLQDIVLDTRSLIKRLTERCPDAIYTGDLALCVEDNQLEGITLDDGSRVHARLYIFAAGSGNGAMIEQLVLPVSMQLRPLNQVVVTGEHLPILYAHAVTLRSADKPRMTITTHHRDDGQTVWYLGGQLAETGVNRTDEEQISHARSELRLLFPWLSFNDCQFSTQRIDRAEASQKDQSRPDTPFVGRYGNVLVCWPTKLTLAPLLGDMVLSELMPAEDNGEWFSNSKSNFDKKFRLGSAPWEHASET